MSQETHIPIIAVLIVKNEEALLARCLDSIKGVDAIYITDTGSEDKTIEIAKKYTNNISHFKWIDSFAAARNFALQQVKEPEAFILSIDADEFLVDFSKVVEAVKIMTEKNYKVADIILVAESSGMEHAFPRLFRKCPEVFWEGVAHNHISKLPELKTEVRIIYGFSPAHEKDPFRTIRILEKEFKENPNCSPRNIFYLGREYWYKGRYKDCQEMMARYIPLSKFLPEKADAFLLMARCLHFMGRWEEARQACAQAILINAHFKEAIEFMSYLAGKGSGNLMWERNAQQWDRMALTADGQGVLFKK